MNPFETDEVIDGICAVVAVRNREEPLRYTLPTMLLEPEIRQVVIVDWGSQPAIHRSAFQWPKTVPMDDRVTIARIITSKAWNLCTAYNFGLSLARCSAVFKLDADVAIVRKLGEVLPVVGDSFVTGRYDAHNSNAAYLNGAMLISRQDILRVGGYDERFVQYGYDDEDLYSRLEASGLTRQYFDPGTLFHLPHSDAIRTSGPPIDSVQRNAAMANAREPWSADYDKAEFELVDYFQRDSVGIAMINHPPG